MLISKLKLQNWRNFRRIEVDLRERVFVIGPNAAGKSNLLDVFRFLRDVAQPNGGGLQRAVATRGGMTKLRCLLARRDPEVLVEVELAERVDMPAIWRYCLAFRSEGKGKQRVILSKEKVEDLRTGQVLINRPDIKDDKTDPERLTETSLEQVNANKDFREIAQFFGSLTYLHLVPQLLKHAELGAAAPLEGDPFGQSFLGRIAKTPERTRDARLKKIETALQACVPNMRKLKFQRDAIGAPHLEALYEHWRPDAGWQREDQFSDGTLRLLAIMWSLLDGDSLLLLEEPELSLNESIVRQIPPLLWQMQRKAKYRRQVFITTHSEALLEHSSVDPREVLRLEPSADGTKAKPATPQEIALVGAGYSVAQAMVPKVDLGQLTQLSIF